MDETAGLTLMNANEETDLLHDLVIKETAHDRFAVEDARLLRKLKLNKLRRAAHLQRSRLYDYSAPTGMLSVEPAIQSQPPPDHTVMEALDAIETTPYYCSFASRINMSTETISKRLIHRDWESRTQWMDLMDDIMLHYSLTHPEKPVPEFRIAPIDFDYLRPEHLPQVHDLLWRTFWPSIDVTDCLDHSPEQCTIVATYKRLVVGGAFLSGPNEGYLMYLVVRAGWDAAGIATFMLYHLITLNRNNDLLLHVSANNPAMLLYNRFGFKAEEFIVGFYDQYLPVISSTCKNAFRLRLRR